MTWMIPTRRTALLACTVALFTFSAAPLAAQKFSVPATGVQSFDLSDARGRNQAVFYSRAPLEDITGTSSGIEGTVRFDPADVVRTISADISIDVTTFKTGIGMRDQHITGENWLDASKYPKVTFILTELKNVKIENNVLTGTAIGEFTLHGVARMVEITVTMTYMPESEKTRTRAPGDLLVVRTKGTLKLSEYGVKNNIIGVKVADDITWEVNAVASNAKKGS